MEQGGEPVDLKEVTVQKSRNVKLQCVRVREHACALVRLANSLVF